MRSSKRDILQSVIPIHRRDVGYFSRILMLRRDHNATNLSGKIGRRYSDVTADKVQPSHKYHPALTTYISRLTLTKTSMELWFTIVGKR
jgi:hypothetical protein